MEFRLLITGGRDFSDEMRMFADLDLCRPDKIIHGGARGADDIAGRWAADRKIDYAIYMADWKSHGRGAGPKRNILMLEAEAPHMVYGYPMQHSIGTWHCLREAVKRGIPVKVHAPHMTMEAAAKAIGWTDACRGGVIWTIEIR